MKPGAIATLLVDNRTDQANVYQVGVAEWLDRADTARVAATTDLLISPQVFRLQPGQVGRVAIRAVRPGIEGSGKAYRVLVRQVSPQKATNDMNINLQIQFNVPLLTRVEP